MKALLKALGCLGWSLAGLVGMSQAFAGITYQLDTAHAAAGETIRVKGVLFNDTNNVLSWKPPATLILQWRSADGQALRSLAYLDSPAQRIELPINNFAAIRWRAVVPKTAKGLQAVNIEGEPVLLALDTSPLERSPIAGTPANTPVLDAGGAPRTDGVEPLLPENIASAVGAKAQGPAPDTAQITATSGFERFRTSFSTFEPVYFDFGNKGGANARFQVSLKYRLATPPNEADTHFGNHLYLGYTQTSLWDLSGESKPFIDTTYNPSLFWQKDRLWESPRKDWHAGLTAGVEHKSNGKSGADSRSVNDFFIEPSIGHRFDDGSSLSFSPRVKAYFSKSENPDYANYAGYVDWKLRWAQDHGLVLSGLYRQGSAGRNAVQLEAAWPLRRTFLNMDGYLHAQYFQGYGETLLGYRERSSPQIRIGLSLVP